MSYIEKELGLYKVMNRVFTKAKHQAGHLRNCLWFKIRKPSLSQKRFIIFGRERTGSTTVVSLMNSVQDVVCQGEILHNFVLFPCLHILSNCARSRAKIYGCKILSYQIQYVQHIRDRINFINDLSEKGFKIIYLTRENLLLQAISNIRASMYGFHKKKSENSSSGKFTVNLKDVLEWINYSESLDKLEKDLLKDIECLHLTYERNIEDEINHQSTVDLICDFLQIESSKVVTEYQKVSPKKLSDSVQNYDELLCGLKDTIYAKYLD